MLMLIFLPSSLTACLDLNVALYNLYAILQRRRQNTLLLVLLLTRFGHFLAEIVCFTQKITTQEGGSRERR